MADIKKLIQFLSRDFTAATSGSGKAVEDEEGEETVEVLTKRLHTAVKNNDGEAVESLLEWLGKNTGFSGVVTGRDYLGRTALHLALEQRKSTRLHVFALWDLDNEDNWEYCDLAIIKSLVQSDKSLCLVKDRNGNIPLHLAAKRGMVDILEILLKYCPESVKELNLEGQTCLQTAVAYNRREAVEYLLNWYGENTIYSHLINKRDRNGKTILHLAIAGRQSQRSIFVLWGTYEEDNWGICDPTIVRSIIQIDKNLCLVKDKDGQTPLHLAAKRGMPDILDILLKACPESVNVITTGGETCLHIAVSYNKSNAVKYLLKWLGENAIHSHIINSKDCKGKTILHLAVSGRPSRNSFWFHRVHLDGDDNWGSFDPLIVTLITEYDKFLCLEKDGHGQTALHLAAKRGSIDILKILLEACPESVGKMTSSMETCLHFAVMHNRTEVVVYLLNWLRTNSSYTYIINSTDRYGKTILHRAVEGRPFQSSSSLWSLDYSNAWSNCNPTIIKSIIESDRNLCLAKDKNKLTPVHVAAKKRRVEVLQLLLNACPESVKELSARGQTCLHIAVAFDDEKVINYLLKWCRENNSYTHLMNSPDANGNTILHLALAAGLPRVSKTLLECKMVDKNAVNNKGIKALDTLCDLPHNGDCDLEIGKIVSGHRALNPLVFYDSSEWRRASRASYMSKIETKKQDSSRMLLLMATLLAVTTFHGALNFPSAIGTSNQVYDLIARRMFMVFNSICFIGSVLTVVFLLREFPLKPWPQVSVSTLFGSYMCLMKAISPHEVLPMLFLSIPFLFMAAAGKLLRLTLPKCA